MGTRERGNDDVWCLFNPRQKWMETERRKREFRQIKHLLGWRQLTGINGRRAQKEGNRMSEQDLKKDAYGFCLVCVCGFYLTFHVLFVSER